MLGDVMGTKRTAFRRVGGTVFGLVVALASMVPVLAAATAGAARPSPSAHTLVAARAAGTCLPGLNCVVLGELSDAVLSTINNGGLKCTITWTVTWGDGTADDKVFVPPGAIVHYSHMYQALGTYTETDTAAIDPQSDSGCFTIPGGWNLQHVWQVVPPLVAKVAPVKPVLRAGHAFLDASASIGPEDITEYQWDFTPAAGCPSGTKLTNESMFTSSPTLDIVVLCDLDAKLTVRDFDGHTASATTHVTVTPRTADQWKPTTVDLVREGSASDARTPTAELLRGKDTVLGRTVSRCRHDSDPGPLCPVTDGLASLEGKAYNVTDVNDPLGPFDGFWFVFANHVTVKQLGLFNPNMFASSTAKHPLDPAHPRRKVNWFTYNRLHKRPAGPVIAAVRAHEGWGKGGSAARPNDSGHPGAKACYLRKDKTRHNPAVVLERLFEAKKADLVSHANDSLRRINNEIVARAKDPLPVIWRGRRFMWDAGAHRWKLERFTIGESPRGAGC